MVDGVQAINCSCNSFFFFYVKLLNGTDLQALGWNRSKVRGVEKNLVKSVIHDLSSLDLAPLKRHFNIDLRASCSVNVSFTVDMSCPGN